MEQPKDYEEFEEFLNSGYGELPFYLKVVYNLQDYIVPVILGSLALGYIAGATFGKFW